MMKAICAFLVTSLFATVAAPASAALITKHFQFTANFTPESGSPIETISGEVKLTFDNAATTFASTTNFSLTGLNIPVSNAPNFSYNASTNNLIIGTLSSPYSAGVRRTHNDFGFFYNVATDSILSLSFTNSTGASFLSRDVTVQAVPEPASWAMMIGGFALAGAAMRRRRATISFA
jgi:hypothetical protein